MRKTNFPANKIKSAPLVSSFNGKKSIRPDESFFDDILNFEDDEEEDETGDLSPPVKSGVRTSKVSEISPRTVNRTKKELRRPFSGTVAKYRSTKTSGESLDTAGVRLSLFEFGHIRVQETRAELESDFEGNEGLRQDLESGRVCFCCQNVRFRMLNWAYSCHFCKRNVKYL